MVSIKNNYFLSSIYIFIFIMISGCATEADYRKVVDSWVGKRSQELVNRWGYPKSEVVAPDKNKVYVYHKSRLLNYTQYYYTNYGSMGYGEYGNSSETGSTTQTIRLDCTTWFEIDRKTQKIKGVAFKGNLCMAGGLGGDHPDPPPTKKDPPR